MNQSAQDRMANLSPLKRALLTLEDMQQKLTALKGAKTEPIAVVGMSCRYADAITPEAFWQLMISGRDAVKEVPKERWDIEAWYHPDPEHQGKMYTRFGSFIEDVDLFDPWFFRITPREAESLDPQHRVLLEVSWEALERAGLAGKSKGSATGVFVGITTSDYAYMLRDAGAMDGYFFTGNPLNAAAGRIAYTYGLEGPCMVTDTACSSSLVAVHQAVSSLRADECETAICGGVNLTLAADTTVAVCRTRALSPDGRCRTFDAAANGFVRGEGCGMLVLKRLSDAQAQNLPILALIRGSAVNQDGASSGFTVPNGSSQRKLYSKAFKDLPITPAQVDFVEFHGTGTELGDPIEVASVGAVFGVDRADDHPLYIGSVKSNIGHTESAAGVAGMIKVILSLQHETLPAHLHFKTPNPHIHWDNYQLKVPVQPVSWPRGEKPRLACVNAFGATGTNAHVILEEAPLPQSITHNEQAYLLLLSAKTEPALRTSARLMAEFLKNNPDDCYADVCATRATARPHFERRLAIPARNSAEAAAHLDIWLAKPEPQKVEESGRPQLFFLFSGQGSQFPGMGRACYEQNKRFRQTLDHCAALLKQSLPLPLLEVMGVVGPSLDPSTTDHPIHNTLYSQPALFALQAALWDMLAPLELSPQGLLGHSVGEFAAAYAAGIFDLETGLNLITKRARLMSELPLDGSMATVFAPYETLSQRLAGEPQVSIAAINGPNATTVSGRRTRLETLLSQWQGDGLKFTRLPVSHAFHSPLMDPMLETFEIEARACQFNPPKLPFYSNLDGQLKLDAPTPNYWRNHCRQPVAFAQTITALDSLGRGVFVELGPQAMLVNLAKRIVTRKDASFLAALQKQPTEFAADRLVAQLYELGFNLNAQALGMGAFRPHSNLPTYPFQKQRCWFTAPASMPGPEPKAIPVVHTKTNPQLDLVLKSQNETLNQIMAAQRALIQPS